ncbi:hypothetical protein Mal15_49010 [Stieleria maiorica]|uniref:Uncharacterized protein n=1 Tax=Stieleria maiorica TaxID=2795974 RepID=A0A5B9MMF9_9BACT|nr:hypothetical protein [Stieleria maiorica]QEG00825.1 hypothetical protein Mal15_49010 [Stieleria maiorica]
MQYVTQLPVHSSEDVVLNKASELLIACGFNVTSQNDNEVKLRGPGMRSTNQNPILGATEITLRRSHSTRGKIAVQADLGGVRWMRNFMIFFPLCLFGGLSAFMVITIAVAFANIPQANFPQGLIEKLLVGAAFMLLLFSCFGVIMTKRIRRNAETAIDACVSNADHLVRRENQ